MKAPTVLRSALLAASLAASFLATSLAFAQAKPPAAATPEIAGTTLDGQAFRLAALRGKVVLVLFWSTDCAVCRDKMPELRQNVQGWQGKPFELVLVATDRRLKDVEDYEAILARTVPVKQRFVQLWAGAPGYRDTLGKPAQLPVGFLVDKGGRVVERFQGRIPAEAWDRIADLL